jgi:hypothetical protein
VACVHGFTPSAAGLYSAELFHGCNSALPVHSKRLNIYVIAASPPLDNFSITWYTMRVKLNDWNDVDMNWENSTMVTDIELLKAVRLANRRSHDDDKEYAVALIHDPDGWHYVVVPISYTRTNEFRAYEGEILYTTEEGWLD